MDVRLIQNSVLNQERCSRKVWYNQEKNITMRTGGMIYGQAQRSVD